MHGILPWLISFLIAHSINFLFNGQLWGVLKHYGLIHLPKKDFETYISAFRGRAMAKKSIEQVLIFGSLARGEWKEHSDFDARIIRKLGFGNGISAAVFLLSERSRALFCVFPLDVYILDGFSSAHLQKLSEDAKDMLTKEWRLL
jgi:predicted nucleotidyltransferase